MSAQEAIRILTEIKQENLTAITMAMNCKRPENYKTFIEARRDRVVAINKAITELSK